MSAECSTPGNRFEPTNVANLRVNQRSQINEDTVSLTAQDINPIACVPDLISQPVPDSYPGRYS